MKFGDWKFDEFVRVTLTATMIVVGSRWLLHYTYIGDWMSEIWKLGQQRIAMIAPPAGQVTSAPRGTPPSIAAANESVVMLTGNQSIGSGVILTSNGLILTNSHVIQKGGDRWKIRLSNERELPAYVVAVGSRESGIFYDLALVQIEGVSNLPVARFSEEHPQAGEPVWAIGAPYGRPEVITQGEVKKVTLDGVLLSSTEVHPGNSGGPLVNQEGEVVGINTEINPSMPAGATTASISVPALQEYLPKLLKQ